MPEKTVEQLKATSVRELTAHDLLRLAREKVEGFAKEGLNIESDAKGTPIGTQGAVIQASRNREYSIAKTAIEDAMVRLVRGMRIHHGLPVTEDLEDPKTLKAAFRAKRDAEEDA